MQIAITGQTAHSGMLQIRAEVVGLEDVEAVCRAIGENAVQAVAGALYREGEAIISDSQTIAPMVPVRNGILRKSGHTQPPVVSGNLVSVECGYGGAATPYALAQHERLDFHHPHVGEGAKYLETHFLRRSVTMDSRIAHDLAPLIENRGALPSAVISPTISASAPLQAHFREFNRAVMTAKVAGRRTVSGTY